MNIWQASSITLLLLSANAVATPPPPMPRTSCTATLCFDLWPEPALIVSRHAPETEHVSSVIQASPGVVLAIVSRPAVRLSAQQLGTHGAVRWRKTSETQAVGSVCLNCGEPTPWRPQWVGFAVSASSPEELRSYLATASVRIRALELMGFYAETSPALRMSEITDAFREHQKFGEWHW